MYVLVTSRPKPGAGLTERRLAAALHAFSPVSALSVHPRHVSWPQGVDHERWDREALALLIRRVYEGQKPSAAFVMDARAAACPQTQALLLKKIPWIFVGNAVRDNALFDCLFGARRIWTNDHARDFPAELRGRLARLPRAALETLWLQRELRALRPGPSAPSRYPLTSLVIPVFDALPLVKRCLASLRRNTTPPHEIIVVDNGSQPAAARYLRCLRGIHLIRNSTNRGFAAAINQGMRASKGRYLAWINSDLVLTPRWLEQLLDCLQSDPNLGAVGPVTNRIAGPAAVAMSGESTASDHDIDVISAAHAMKFAGRHEEVHRLAGFCVLLRQHAIEAVGLLDERFGLGCYEDYDYSLRLRQAGFKLAIARDTFVYHRYHGSFKSGDDLRRGVEDNRRVFVEKWCSRALEFLDEIDPLLARKR